MRCVSSKLKTQGAYIEMTDKDVRIERLELELKELRREKRRLVAQVEEQRRDSILNLPVGARVEYVKEKLVELQDAIMGDGNG
jgi:hypothetical protein